MGSQPGTKGELTVLVTGFGPFRTQYPVNPSYEIARQLPAYLPPLRAKDPSSRTSPSIPEVRILVHPEPIRVSYRRVGELVPTWWDEDIEDRRIDLAIHIGMAGPRPYYQIERKGHREGYKSKDVDGLVGDIKDKGREWKWYGCPAELESDLNMDDVLGRWQAHSPKGMDLRISEDAGHYLCDYTYYSSLAHLWKQQRERKVTFLHVPADASPASISIGRELAINLIRAMVESEVVAKDRDLARQTKAGDEHGKVNA